MFLVELVTPLLMMAGEIQMYQSIQYMLHRLFGKTYKL